jgi:hypothetical protein
VQLNRTSELEARTSDRVPLNVFLSYSPRRQASQGDLSAKPERVMEEEVHQHMARWADRNRACAGGKRSRKTWRRWDLFIGLVTTPFLASSFIEQVEIKAARESADRRIVMFIFVLILVRGRQPGRVGIWPTYQLLNLEGKAICQYNSRRAGFNLAQERSLKSLSHRDRHS